MPDTSERSEPESESRLCSCGHPAHFSIHLIRIGSEEVVDTNDLCACCASEELPMLDVSAGHPEGEEECNAALYA